MRISDWSSDVCSSDLADGDEGSGVLGGGASPSPALDAALVAVVAGRAEVDVGDVVALEEVARNGLDFCGRDHLAGAVDEAVVGAVAAQEHGFAAQKHGRPAGCRHVRL